VNSGVQSAVLLRLDDAVFAHDAFIALPDRAVLPVLNTRAGLPPRAVLVRGLGVRIIHLPDLDADVCGGAAAPEIRDSWSSARAAEAVALVRGPRRTEARRGGARRDGGA
jgi:hypothetical protein